MIMFFVILAITLIAFTLFGVVLSFSDKKECNCKKARRIVATYGKDKTSKKTF